MNCLVKDILQAYNPHQVLYQLEALGTNLSLLMDGLGFVTVVAKVYAPDSSSSRCILLYLM